MADGKDTMLTKLIGAGVTLAAAWLAQKALASAWKAASGHNPPDPEDDARFAEIAAAAVVTGAIVAFARVMAMRGTAKYLKSS
ncbi:DUF4235 domain-containing protein [Actinotalea sp. K2]|uniref:DUF4235 domain-containing protein n=1 Tax=Actinotalea sp. K2 TaxID=2939438 RepID=UPI002018045F|nr:DUF4235 domain-containing protein [Actinotalea sp. K2]MCL3861766.1 DUF4235 domain-containing protein [Actinotalea sp. K2]